MKTKIFFFFLLILSINSWISTSYASVQHAYLNNTGSAEWYYFCSVDTIIVHKPTNAINNIDWNPPIGPNIYNADSVIITIATGTWQFYSDEVVKYFYIYNISLPPYEPPCMVNDTSFCTSTFSLPLDAVNHLPGGYASTYLWSTGATTRTITATTPGTYSVTITNDCGTGVYSINVIQANPNAPNLGANQTFCWGSTTTLDPLSTNVGSYQWSTGEITPTITVDTTGNYWVYLLDNNGCSGVDTIQVITPVPTSEEICYVEFDTLTGKNKINWTINLPGNSDSVRIYKEVSLGIWNLIGVVNNTSFNFIDNSSNPQAQSYSYKIAIVDTCENESVLSGSHTTITLLSTYDLGTDTYGFTWSDYLGLTVSDYFLYGITSTGTVSQIGTVPGNIHMYNYLNPSSAYVKYFVGFVTPDCNSKANVIVKSNWVQSVVTGINQIETLQFGIHPNPANDKIEIFTQESEYEIQILNLLGQVLLDESNNKTIDVSMFSEGTYIVRLKVGMTIGHQKIIVY